MSIVKQAESLYVVDDKKAIKNYVRQDADYWIRFNTVPTLEQVVEDMLDNEDFVAQPYEDAIRNKKDWLEMISVYDMAKTVQNIVSYSVSDLDESTSESKMKLRIRESFDKDDLSILIDEYFDADIDDLTDYHFESGLWTLDAEYRDRLVNVIRYDGNEVAVFGYCGFPKRPIYNGLYTNSVPELGYSSKDLKQRIKYLITQHGAEVI